jgi:predicted RNase H-like HicB family nuclease
MAQARRGLVDIWMTRGALFGCGRMAVRWRGRRDRQALGEAHASLVMKFVTVSNTRCIYGNSGRAGVYVMNIKAIIHEAEEGGFWAEVPAIPGCATQGGTMEELVANLHEAIEGCLSVDVETPHPGCKELNLDIAV